MSHELKMGRIVHYRYRLRELPAIIVRALSIELGIVDLAVMGNSLASYSSVPHKKSSRQVDREWHWPDECPENL